MTNLAETDLITRALSEIIAISARRELRWWNNILQNTDGSFSASDTTPEEAALLRGRRFPEDGRTDEAPSVSSQDEADRNLASDSFRIEAANNLVTDKIIGDSGYWREIGKNINKVTTAWSCAFVCYCVHKGWEEIRSMFPQLSNNTHPLGRRGYKFHTEYVKHAFTATQNYLYKAYPISASSSTEIPSNRTEPKVVQVGDIIVRNRPYPEDRRHPPAPVSYERIPNAPSTRWTHGDIVVAADRYWAWTVGGNLMVCDRRNVPNPGYNDTIDSVRLRCYALDGTGRFTSTVPSSAQIHTENESGSTLTAFANNQTEHADVFTVLSLFPAQEEPVPVDAAPGHTCTIVPNSQLSTLGSGYYIRMQTSADVNDIVRSENELVEHGGIRRNQLHRKSICAENDIKHVLLVGPYPSTTAAQAAKGVLQHRLGRSRWRRFRDARIHPT